MPHAATWNESYFGASDILVYTYIHTCFTPKYATLFLLLYYINLNQKEIQFCGIFTLNTILKSYNSCTIHLQIQILINSQQEITICFNLQIWKEEMILSQTSQMCIITIKNTCFTNGDKNKEESLFLACDITQSHKISDKCAALIFRAEQ